MSIAEMAIVQMEQWAKNPLYGYDQTYRWGEKGDYDCSSAVITAWDKAGVPVKSAGATYTGNMYNAFISCGFKDVTNFVNLYTGSGLKRADVLLNKKNHTAMYCGNGKEVEASINENGQTTGGQAGDQTGKEFLIRSYRNYPWDCVLRYMENFKEEYTDIAQDIYNLLRASGTTHAGACGILGNLEAESALSPTNLENSYEGRYTDSSYTKAVDNGTYANFANDRYGYGLAQWTFPSRKQGLLNYAKQLKVSIGDLTMQTQYLVKELKSDFPKVWNVVTSTNSIQEASNAMLLEFERPANAISRKSERYDMSNKYNDLKITNSSPKVITVTIKNVNVSLPQLSKGACNPAVAALQTLLNANKFNCGQVDGDFGSNTENALKAFQRKNDLEADGICGPATWSKLING